MVTFLEKCDHEPSHFKMLANHKRKLSCSIPFLHGKRLNEMLLLCILCQIKGDIWDMHKYRRFWYYVEEMDSGNLGLLKEMECREKVASIRLRPLAQRAVLIVYHKEKKKGKKRQCRNKREKSINLRVWMPDFEPGPIQRRRGIVKG